MIRWIERHATTEYCLKTGGSRNHITDHGFACAFCVSCAGFLSEEVVQNYDIAGRSWSGSLRQWLDDLGMSFFECDNCQLCICPICRISTVSLMLKSICR